MGAPASRTVCRYNNHYPRCREHFLTPSARPYTHRFGGLGLKEITLYLTDWGGPIGLDFARKHPGRVKRLVISNTWCWPVSRDFHFVFFSSLMASPLGQLLVKRFNAFVNQVMPRAVGRKQVLTPEVMAHYRGTLPPGERSACAALPGHIIGATEWLASIWEKRDSFADRPSLLLWGLRDIAFRRKELERWKSELSDFQVHEFHDCGHFLAEEAPNEVASTFRTFMSTT